MFSLYEESINCRCCNYFAIVCFSRGHREVETMVSTSGLSIVSLTPQSQAEKGGAYKKYDAQLRVEGAPEKIYNFIYKVQNSRLLIELSNITVTPKNPEANLLKLETTISLTVL